MYSDQEIAFRQALFLRKYGDLLTELSRQEWYGGSYFDEDDMFHLLVTRNYSARHDSTCDAFIDDSCLDFVDKSYAELAEKSHRLLNSGGGHILGVGVDERSNRVMIAADEFVSENDYPDCQVLRFTGFTNQSDLHMASKLNNNRCSFALGYPVCDIDEENYGFITAGHLADNAKGDEIYLDDEKIGTVYDFSCSDSMDSTFVKTDSRLTFNNILISPACQVTGQAPCLLQGASVVMYGGVSGNSCFGKVIYPKFNFLEHKNVMLFSYLSENGDSGSPIIMPVSKETGLLVGIHIGTVGLNNKHYSFGYAAECINSRFSLKFDLSV